MATSSRLIPRLNSITNHLHPTSHILLKSATASSTRPATSIRSAATMASHSVPKTMKGVLIEKTGGVDVLQYRTDLPVPTPKEDEVLVKNEYIGVNFIDTYFRTGLYPSTFPLILGRDASGTIVSAPSTAPYNLTPGTHVVYLATGSYAEYNAVPVSKTIAIPSSVPLRDAAAALLQGVTAQTMIDEAHKVEKGDWVLVPAAAGGVGLWLCQLLRARGAHTIAAASSEEKRRLALEYGAEVAVGYEGILEAVEKHTGGKGVRASFDGVGKTNFETSLKAVGRKGTIVRFGSASGAVEPLTISRLTEKNLKVCRPTLFGYIVEREEFEGYVKELFEGIERGDLRVNVHEVYPLEDVARAHTDIEGRKTTGKLLLKP